MANGLMALMSRSSYRDSAGLKPLINYAGYSFLFFDESGTATHGIYHPSTLRHAACEAAASIRARAEINERPSRISLA